MRGNAFEAGNRNAVTISPRDDYQLVGLLPPFERALDRSTDRLPVEDPAVLRLDEAGVERVRTALCELANEGVAPASIELQATALEIALEDSLSLVAGRKRPVPIEFDVHDAALIAVGLLLLGADDERSADRRRGLEMLEQLEDGDPAASASSMTVS